MRLYCVILTGGLLWSGGASASSFVTIPARGDQPSPSIVHLGAPAAQPPVAAAPKSSGFSVPVAISYPKSPPPDLVSSAPRRISASVIAVGQPPPDVEDFRVAAIKPEPRPHRVTMPMVIRGGLTGEAFGSSSPAPQTPLNPAPAQASLPPPAPGRNGPPAPGTPSEPTPEPAPPPSPRFIAPK